MRFPMVRAVALGAALAVGGLAVEITPASASVDTGADEVALVGRINAERAGAGLAPLAMDGRLFDSARAWSATQASAGSLSHDASYFGAKRPSGAGIVAENVAYNMSAGLVHERLMASPGHRANILDPAFTSVGVGEVVSADGRVFVTQRFAKSDAPTASPGKATVKKATVKKAKAKKGKPTRRRR